MTFCIITQVLFIFRALEYALEVIFLYKIVHHSSGYRRDVFEGSIVSLNLPVLAARNLHLEQLQVQDKKCWRGLY